MIRKFSRKTALRGSVCTAVLLAAPAAIAQDYASRISFDLNYDGYTELYSYNYFGVEGALGATAGVSDDLTETLSQTALSQLNNAAARVSADYNVVEGEISTGTGLLVDLEQYSGSSNGELLLGAYNRAEAYTTQLDALLGASQIGMVSFNTATLEAVEGSGNTALIGMDQTLDGDAYAYYGYSDPFDFNLSAVNELDAAAAYAGTARIDGGVKNENFGQVNIPNPDYVEGGDEPEFIADEDELLSSVQQAAVSLNTLRITSTGEAAPDVQLELAGQGFDAAGFSSRSDMGYWSQNFSVGAYNSALAMSPRPATAEFVDPRLVSAQNDPSIANLDQIAALTLNSMSFGTAESSEVVEVEGAPGTYETVVTAAGTEDYTVLADGENTFGDGTAQYAGFSGMPNNYELPTLFLGNQMAAVTDPEDYLELGGELDADYMFAREAGIGNVRLGDVSQVAALTANEIRQNGDGDLTLKAGYYGDYGFNPTDFVQRAEGPVTVGGYIPGGYYDYWYSDLEGVNYAVADTEEGSAAISNLSQIAQFGFNAISSGGDINGWTDSDAAIVQTSSVDFQTADYYSSQSLNYAEADTDVGNASAEDLEQIAQVSFNTLRAGGDLNANLDQYLYDPVDFDDDVNEIDVESDDRGNASLADAAQTLVLNMNTVSVSGEVTGDVYQEATDVSSYVANEAYVYANNDVADLRNVGGNASIDGLTQTLVSNVNSFSAGGLDGASVEMAAYDVNVPLENYAYVDSEYGVASAERVVQTALNRVNYMSIASGE